MFFKASAASGIPYFALQRLASFQPANVVFPVRAKSAMLDLKMLPTQPDRSTIAATHCFAVASSLLPAARIRQFFADDTATCE